MKSVNALFNVYRYVNFIDELLYICICVFLAVGVCEISVYGVCVYIYLR